MRHCVIMGKVIWQVVILQVKIKLNSLPKDKFFDESNLKAFADNKINANEKLKLLWEG